jgi:hypothetical protein
MAIDLGCGDGTEAVELTANQAGRSKRLPPRAG